MQFTATLPDRFRQISRAVVDAVLPPRCLACGEIVEERLHFGDAQGIMVARQLAGEAVRAGQVAGADDL